MIITDKLINDIDNYLLNTLSKSRYRHSKSTAETAVKLCKLFNVDERKGYLAALVHDIARELDYKKLSELAVRYGSDKIDDDEKNTPDLLHGRAGAVMAKDIFSITDLEILDAISQHTAGEAGMKPLAKVIFIADYIEPLRKHITQDYVDSLAGKTLDAMFETVLNSIVDYLKSKSIRISQKTFKLLEEIDERKRQNY